MNTWDPDDYVRALRFAAERHGAEDQKIPGTDLPYVLHVVSVCMEVQTAIAAGERSFDANLAVVVALLHDVVEDTPTTLAEVDALFGTRVMEGVSALTKYKSLPKHEVMADSLRRIRQQPSAIAAVKLADRVTNLAPPPPHWDREKRARYREEAAAILQALSGTSALLERRLEARLTEYARYVGD